VVCWTFKKRKGKGGMNVEPFFQKCRQESARRGGPPGGGRKKVRGMTGIGGKNNSSPIYYKPAGGGREKKKKRGGISTGGGQKLKWYSAGAKDQNGNVEWEKKREGRQKSSITLAALCEKRTHVVLSIRSREKNRTAFNGKKGGESILSSLNILTWGNAVGKFRSHCGRVF